MAAKVPFAKNVSEWFAFFGGEELGISLEHASIVWDAATKAAEESQTSNIKQSTPCFECQWIVIPPDVHYCYSCGRKVQ